MSGVTDRKDVFLCHTSADKERFVHPFIKELDKRGISYWIDEAEIEWGDPISQKIDYGLRISKYVLVFLSEDFIGRNWPESELASALSKENSKGEKVVLPLIIGDKEIIFERYSLLRGKHCKFWREGIPSIVAQLRSILRRIEDAATSDNTKTPPIRKRPNQSVGVHFVSGRAWEDTLLKELNSYAAILYRIQETKASLSDIRYVLNNFLRILMTKYGLIERDVTDISRVFQEELQSLSSPSNAFRRDFPRDLQRLNRSVDEVKGIVVDIDSFLKQKTPLPESTKYIMNQLHDLLLICLNLLLLGEPSDISEIRQMLTRVESSNLEFKSYMKWDIKKERANIELVRVIAKEVTGFMNSEGGTLIIGVDDWGNVLGLEKDFSTFRAQDTRKLQDVYVRTFYQRVSKMLGGQELSPFIKGECVEIDGKVIFVATIKKSHKPVFFIDGDRVEFYVRIGNSTRPFNIREAIEYYEIHFVSNKGD